jgi:ribosomal protein S18 acetylase RimI-like enzyme
MLQQFEVRLAGAADAETLVEFNIAMAQETEHKELLPEVVLSGVRRLLERPDAGFYLVATGAQEIVGALMVTFEWSDWRDGCFWWIQSVYVKPAFRRQGVLSRLFEQVKSLATRRGDVCGLRLYVERENLNAQHSYRSLGMCETAYRVWECPFDSHRGSE